MAEKENSKFSYDSESVSTLITAESADWDKDLIKFASQIYVSRSILGKDKMPIGKSESLQIAMVAQKYGLDPMAGHIIWYNNKPYVSVSGLLYQAQHSQDFEAIVTEILCGEEREKMIEGMGLCNEGIEFAPKRPIHHCIVRATLYRKGFEHNTVCYSSASIADVGSFLANDLKNIPAMAATRATGRVCRTAYGCGMPIYEEIGVEEKENKPASFSENFKGE